MLRTFSLRLPEDTHSKLRIMGLKKGMSAALVELLDTMENDTLPKDPPKSKITSLALTDEQLEKIKNIGDKNNIGSKAKTIIALVDKAWEIRKKNLNTDNELGNIL